MANDAAAFLVLGPLEVRAGGKEHLARRSTAACGARRSGAACGLGGLEGHADRRPLGGSAAADGRSGRAERRVASAARAREGGDRDARRRVFAPRGAGRGRRPPLRAARPRCAAASARRALGRPPRRVGAVARIAVRRPLVRELPPGGDRAARRAPADGARGSRRGRDRARRARRRDSRRRPAGRAAPGSRAALPSPDACVLQGGAAAGGARRLRGDAPRARRAVGTRTLPRDPRAPPDDPLAGSRACPRAAGCGGDRHGATAGLAAPRRAARRRRPRARGRGRGRPGRPPDGRRRRLPARRRALTGIGSRARRRVRRRRRARGRRRPRRPRGRRGPRGPARP